MKNVLVFCDNFDTGGVTSVMKILYENLNDDFRIDFIRRNTNINEFDELIKRKGNAIYYYVDCGLNSIPIWNYKHRQLYIAKQVITQVKESGIHYDVIHVHANPIIGLYIGKKLGVRVRIMHTHEAVSDFGEDIYNSKITKRLWQLRQVKYNRWATIKAGDSLKACCAKFGDGVVNDHKLRILYPPVDMVRFNPNLYADAEINTLGISKEAFNIIHVGRLSPVKNQRFLIEVFSEICKTTNAFLFIVGEGSLKDELLAYAKELEVSKYVKFLSADTSPAIYKMMDCSILPSLSEAFGMVAVESQLMGVPCFASTNVPRDVDIGMCAFFDLGEGAKAWADRIIDSATMKMHVDLEKKMQFDSKTLINDVETLYNND